MPPRTEGVDIGRLAVLALWRWARWSPARWARVGRRLVHVRMADRRRVRRERRIEGVIPLIVAISPTMRCNYQCVDCYSSSCPKDDELTAGELDALLGEAEDLGVLGVVVVGGEPLLIEDIVGILASHQRLFVALFTNGSLVSAEIARELAGSHNILPFVSVEGTLRDTDGRRQVGAHKAALSALSLLQDAGACFGFSAMSTAHNGLYLTSEAFIEQMASLGCVLGFLTEYTACEASMKPEWSPTDAARRDVRRRVLNLRRRKKFMLMQFPYDEYAVVNRCSAALRSLLHVTSQGDVEPCPLVPVTCGNIRQGGLTGVCTSSFLAVLSEMRGSLKQNRPVCRLFAHQMESDAIRERT